MKVNVEMLTQPGRAPQAIALGAVSLLFLGSSQVSRASETSHVATAANTHLVYVRTALTPTTPVPSASKLDASETLVPHTYAMKGRQVPSALRFVEANLRLGAAVIPRLKFDGGVDFRFPHLGLGNNFSTRVDIDAILDANFGGVSTLIPVTVDEVYTRRMPGATLYAGAGIGGFVGKYTRFGGKLFVGGGLGERVSLEGAVLFPGYGDAIFTVQLRTPIF